MHNTIRPALALLFLAFFCCSCEKENSVDTGANARPANLNFIYKFDSLQVRLDGLGQPTAIPIGNAGQSPRFNGMSAHYIELTPNAFTSLGGGEVLYHAPEVTSGGATAIDFTRMTIRGNGDVFFSIPLTEVQPGTYNWLRVSLAYQNYTITIHGLGTSAPATVASFIGYRTYIPNFRVKDSTVAVNANRDQGYWAFEGSLMGAGFLRTGQAPPGATTVPNPLFASSPIPAGSCVVTGQFGTPLTITGNETSDINIEVSLSTNRSFEWRDVDGNGTFDPLNGDAVVDMGIRGMLTRRL
jgi:hypothetical protein